MPNFRRIGSIALITAIALSSMLNRANAQAVIGLPIVETIVIVGAAGAITTLYVWYVDGIRHESSTYPVLDDPEEEAQWGVYPDVKSFEGCRWAAAGRDWNWDRKTSTCYIKG